MKGDVETTKQKWWECAAIEECRKDVKNEISQEDLDALPQATKSCGIILDDPELDEWFSRLAGDGQDEEETWPPQEEEEDNCSDFSYESDGFIKVAGDGACPNGQRDMRLRGQEQECIMAEEANTTLSYQFMEQHKERNVQKLEQL